MSEVNVSVVSIVSVVSVVSIVSKGSLSMGNFFSYLSPIFYNNISLDGIPFPVTYRPRI
jgi:hypothetical protein